MKLAPSQLTTQSRAVSPLLVKFPLTSSLASVILRLDIDVAVGS